MILPEVTTLAEARDAIRDLAEEVEKLSNELTWFKRQMFGSKTEHYIPRDDTPSLFPEEMSPESPKEVPTATVAEHERKVRQPNALSEIPADLPREERVIDEKCKIIEILGLMRYAGILRRQIHIPEHFLKTGIIS